ELRHQLVVVQHLDDRAAVARDELGLRLRSPRPPRGRCPHRSPRPSGPDQAALLASWFTSSLPRRAELASGNDSRKKSQKKVEGAKPVRHAICAICEPCRLAVTSVIRLFRLDLGIIAANIQLSRRFAGSKPVTARLGGPTVKKRAPCW